MARANRRRNWISLLILLTLMGASTHALEDVPELGMVALFGNLHAHSNLSEDVRDPDGTLSPKAAFDYARAHGIDFLAITDHHQPMDSAWTSPVWFGASAPPGKTKHPCRE